jgi:transcriptional regulator with XRE-family HTH domain
MVDLKTFRKKNGITQKELAKFLGITHGFISQVELGKSRLPEDKLEKLLNNDRGWAVDDLVEAENSINLQTEVERLNKTIDGLNETIRIQGETIKTQSETIAKQSETINVLIVSKEGHVPGHVLSAHSTGTQGSI